MPSREDEERRHLHRDLEEMKAETTQHRNRIRGLLAGVGARVAEINSNFLEMLPTLQTADGREIPGELRARLLREFERLQFVSSNRSDPSNGSAIRSCVTAMTRSTWSRPAS